MKNISMQVYKLVTLLVLLLFVNCQKEDFSSNQSLEEVTKPLYKQRTVSLSEIPKIEQEVIEKLNPEIFNRTEGSTNNQAIFDTENVLEIIDTLNNANYSLQFRFPDTPISTFYNLVVGETPSGEVLTPYIMKYKCDDASLDDYIANGLDFSYFEGTMSIHKYTDFFALGEFDRTETQCPPELNEVGDPIPCTVTNVSGSGSLGGFGSGSGTGNSGSGTGNIGGTGGTGGGGSFGCVYQGVYVVGCGGDLSDSLHPYGECWNPTGTGVQQYNLWECYGEPVNPTSPNQGEGEDIGRTVNDDCPGCDTNDGGVPINTIGNLIDKDALTIVNNCMDLDFDQTQIVVNNHLETAMANYITENGCSTETQQFLEEAIEAVEEGGEVDFDDNVILSTEFINNEKLKCVYDKLAGDGSNLFKDTIGTFINNPNVNLIFTVGDCVSTNVACTQDQYLEETGIITVTIEDVSLNPIELAQTILHEAIHAEIAKYVSEFQSGVDPNNRTYLFQLYAYYKDWADTIDPDFNWDNAADHQAMITNYVNKIASTLHQFDNNRYPIDYYKDYAWDGLRDNYNYTGTLSDSDAAYYTSLRSVTNTGIEVCN